MIHKTAIIDKNAKISSNVEIGPYCIIGPNVEIDSGTKLYSHVNLVETQKLAKIISFFHLHLLEHCLKI